MNSDKPAEAEQPKVDLTIDSINSLKTSLSELGNLCNGFTGSASVESEEKQAAIPNTFSGLWEYVPCACIEAVGFIHSSTKEMSVLFNGEEFPALDMERIQKLKEMQGDKPGLVDSSLELLEDSINLLEAFADNLDGCDAGCSEDGQPCQKPSFLQVWSKVPQRMKTSSNRIAEVCHKIHSYAYLDYEEKCENKC